MLKTSSRPTNVSKEDCFKHYIKTEYEKNTSPLGNRIDKVPKFNAKKWVEVYDQSSDTYDSNKRASRPAIFREYLLSVPLALQYSGHPGKI